MLNITQVKKTKKFILKAALVIAVIVLIRFFQQQDLTIGVAPTFLSKNLLGGEIGLNSPPKTATLVHFWATWCGVCALENDNIQAIVEQKKYPVLNIAWQSGSNESLLQYAKDKKLDPNQIINDQYGTLAKLYGANATPISFIVDKQGNIAFSEVGYTTQLGLQLRLWWANQ